MMENRIVIIDGNSLINRAYYAMQRPMITKEGVYTQGIYGFINMLTKIREDYTPGYIAVAWDRKAPTFRHLEYDKYKAGRKKMQPELAMEIPLMKEILTAMKIEKPMILSERWQGSVKKTDFFPSLLQEIKMRCSWRPM